MLRFRVPAALTLSCYNGVSIMKRTALTDEKASGPGESQGSPVQSHPDNTFAQLLINLLTIQCLLSRAEEGSVLRLRDNKQVEVLAIYPQSGSKVNECPPWIMHAAESVNRAIQSDSVLVIPWNRVRPERSQDQVSSHSIFLARVNMGNVGPLVAVFLIATGNQKTLDTPNLMIQLSLRMLALSEKWFVQQERPGDIRPFQQAMETLSSTNSQEGFTRAVMAFCNEMATQWQCERVSLGFLNDRYVELKAMSHTEEVSRKMQIVQAIESAMEECLDQDIEVLSPPPHGATFISRNADELSKQHGGLTVLSLPLRRNGSGFAVVTLERPAGTLFTQEEIEALRLTCELCTARLADLYEHGRWFGATLALKTRKLLSQMVGPEQTTIKVAGIICAAVILFLIFAKGQFKIETPFALEATYQQVIPAPFDGYINDVKVEVNEPVEANKTIMATLDTSELRLKLAASKAEMAGYMRQASVSMRDGQIAQSQIARANADKMTAQINLLNYRIGRSDILSPISGFVVKGDLKKQIGAPVRTGDVLFEVSPLESLRAELLVPEDDIFDIKPGQEGQLTTASYPGQRIKFTVERVNPVAEVVNQRNIFKVRVSIHENYPWLRPGMEGVAKVSIDRRRYSWIWTHKAINWVRMKLWI